MRRLQLPPQLPPEGPRRELLSAAPPPGAAVRGGLLPGPGGVPAGGGAAAWRPRHAGTPVHVRCGRWGPEPGGGAGRCVGAKWWWWWLRVPQKEVQN